MAKALYRKWRPQDWSEVIAQEHVTQTLRNAVINDRVAHAYLFAGPRGTGKTTTARLLAKAVNCLDPDLHNRPCNQCDHCKSLNEGRFMDLIEIDAASNTSVDDVRDLRDKINFAPSQGKFKVYIIDEVHMLSTAAFNALLKTLEEPPPHAIFILATTEIHKIPATVLSRCQQHEFRRIPVKDIVDLLKQRSEQEGFKVADPVFTLIARQATGSFRDAISLFDQLSSLDEMITLEMAEKVMGTATNLSVIEVVDHLVARNTADGLSQINKSLDSGTDPRQLARQLVTYLRNVLLFKMNNDDQVEVADTVKEKIFEHANKFTINDLLLAINAFNDATSETHANWHPGLGLELAFTTYLAAPSLIAGQHEHPGAGEQTAPTQQVERPTQQKAAKKAVTKQTPAPAQIQTEPDDQIPQSIPTPKVKNTPEPIKPKMKEPEDVPAPSKETTETKTNPVSGEVSLKDIQNAWGQIKTAVGKHNRRTEGLLNSSRLAGLNENMLILGFSSEILKEMMEKEGNLNLTADILEEVLGQALAVKCIVTSSQVSALPDDLEIDKDGMVGTATRDLGGKISSAKEIE
jgi:DNA polymerase-3 subunit gamma/tau